jgi:protoheme ferro-lyase
MAKAINWPENYRDFWLHTANTTDTYCALRLGDLYFSNHYWVLNEVVDLRANHKRLRKATVTKWLEQHPLQAFTPTLLASLPPNLQSIPAIQVFLMETYQQPVTPDTLVTVVHYQCHAVDMDEVEAA